MLRKIIWMFDIPLDLANAIYNTANAALILGAILVAGGTITTIWTGGIRDRFADERISENKVESLRAVAGGASANEVAARANERAATLENEAEQARLETERLRQQMAWRRLSEGQIETSASGLAGLAIPLQMAAIANDPESMLFASDIRRALQAVGIETQIDSVIMSGAVVGIVVKGPKDDNTLRVGRAFQAAGLYVQFQVKAGNLEILVGSKPPPQ
jgi:hypothetical protein